ncbi:MAG TPA: TIGR00725 family protein [Pyrinomonadaceae bacterium]|nr:TIGR00725 family protein [Pyrinomonadaceae bacterium]
MSRIVVGVMGPGAGAKEEDVCAAYELGRLIAAEGWVLLTGGRAAGVMEAATRGAREAGGLTVGVLPTEDARGAATDADLLILTGMGQARNNVNVLSSRAVVACGMGAGTAAEVALAVKARRRVVLLNSTPEAERFFTSLAPDLVETAPDAASALELLRRIVNGEA